MSKITPTLEKFLVNRYIDIDDYRGVREDFLDIYKTILDLESIQKSIDKETPEEIREKALEAHRQCVQFDPHSIITTPIGNAKSLYRLILAVVVGIGLILSFIGVITSETLLRVIEGPPIIRYITNLGVPITFIGIVFLYFESLKRDTLLIREMNKRIRIGEEIITEESKKNILYSYYIWNTSLQKNQKLPVLAFLVILKALSPNTYRRAMRSIPIVLENLLETDRSLVESAGRASKKVEEEIELSEDGE